MVFIASAHGLLALTTLAAYAVSASPTVEAYPNMHVLIRNHTDSSYIHSKELDAIVRGRFQSLPIKKRLHATVQACYNSDCTNCRVIVDGSTSACIHAAGTECLIIYNLDGANIEYWSGASCSGRNTVYRGCGSSVKQGAPNTNSVGVHGGC